MTFIPEKKDALYVRGVVIAAGMPDDQGDIAPNKEGIKRIFTNYLKQESDVQHSYISNFNVHQLENTITTAPMQINGQDVPVGSWIASHMVLNPSIVAMIRANNLTGYSLGAIGDAGLNENIEFENNFLNKSSLMYKDLRDYEELNPFFISFVDKASNGFTWEVMDYTQFLSKSSSKTIDESITGDMMTDTIREENDEMVKVSVVERLLGPLLNKAAEAETSKEEEEEEAAADVEEETSKEEEDEKLEKETSAETEISNKEIMAKLDELPSLVANGVVAAMKELANETSTPNVEGEAALEKASDEEKEEEEGDQVETTENPETSEAETEKVEDDEKLEKSSQSSETKSNEDEKMRKSSNKLDEMSKPKPKPEHRFLGSERRDEYGRVRKYV